MKICGLLGQNITYSKSPEIHSEYYKLKCYGLEYKIFDLEEKEIEIFINNLRNSNIIGFNVTIPYKEKIIKYLDTVTYPANTINAVNTVLVTEDELVGYNTDYSGFMKSLKVNSLNIENGKALIIGAGGAAKAVYHGLLDLNCNDIEIVTRNVNKAAEYFGNYSKIFSSDSIKDLSKYNIIINCTPLGGKNYMNMLPIEVDTIKANCIAYDLVYNPAETRFLHEAKIQGAQVFNGEAMLKFQAYEAADIWADYLYGGDKHETN
ncbi:shikimate dehydrogenase [Candidatus Clostridium radicumherbarum]|uniref:Shikimate dehydrogenase (NADP(+)) n=1 Tax=Candidatus Clostridium radicumherbarum TaxID=3381662 RepID=A0ABW8TRR6_9CLOT